MPYAIIMLATITIKRAQLCVVVDFVSDVQLIIKPLLTNPYSSNLLLLDTQK